MAEKTIEIRNLITLTQVRNGQPGAPGAPGESSDSYRIESNTEEIVWFISNNAFEFSPTILKFKVFKMNDPVANISKDNIYFKFYSTSEEEYDIKEGIKITSTEIGDNTFSTFSFDIWNFLQANNNIEDEKVTAFNAFLQEGKPIIFSFLFIDAEKNIYCEKRISLRRGISTDILQFSVTASAITTLVDKSKLTFSEDGLIITNAEFKILKSLEEEVSPTTLLEVDKEGNLVLNRIVANTGTIGGFNILENELVSSNGDLILNGNEGKIKVENIELGEGAVVANYIEFSRDEEVAYLFNPAGHEGVFIQAGKKDSPALQIYANGKAMFGDIAIDGTQSTIRGENWSLTPEYAKFKNVSVSGAIETAVFKIGSVQAAGSAMLFMPSYKVEGFEEEIKEEGTFIRAYFGESISNLAVGTLGWMVYDAIDSGSSSYKRCEIIEIVEKENSLKVKLEKTQNEIESLGSLELGMRPVALVIIGNKNKSNLVFGVNSLNTEVAEGFIKGRGLTISTFSQDDSNSKYPNLFLGDLDSLNTNDTGTLDQSLSGFGLYCDNVYLTGSLTTQTGENSYAGVNTLSEVEAKVFTNDSSKIVFWAGATSRQSSSIQQAPFQVTEKGSVYAAQATFTDSIFVKGSIRGAEIYTAKIYGNGRESGDGEEPALTIYDTSGGIVFKGQGDNGEYETCRINATEFYIQDENVKIRFNGGERQTLLFKDGLFCGKDNNDTNYGLKFGKNAVSLVAEKEDKITINESQVSINSNLIAKQIIEFGEGNGHLKYQPTNDGYDLYVIS